MRHPLVVKGRLLQGGTLARGAVAIDPERGTILAVGPDLRGDDEHDHGDHLLLPGSIDIHVHFRDPGHPHKEDFASGTLSALHGGVTTIYDMPNTDPPTISAQAFRHKTEAVAAKAYVDWGLYVGATAPGPALHALARLAPAIKIYLGESTGNVTLGDAARLQDVFADLHAAQFSGVVAFHAEAGVTMKAAHENHATDPGLAGHAARRPVEAELTALDQVHQALAAHRQRHGPPRFRLHIAHASSAALIRRLITDKTSFGVTPHHLLLDHDQPLGARGRVNPPLRSPEDATALRRTLAAGQIPILESDHAPHTVAEKDQDVATAPSGIPGVETLAPLMLGLAASGSVPLAHVVDALTRRPADLMGIPKGRLAPGYDADLAVYDLSTSGPLDPSRLHSRAGWSPFDGHDVVFPAHVYVRGVHALDDGTLRIGPGAGRPVQRRTIATGAR